MMSAQSNREYRLHELLAARALGPLTNNEVAELQMLQDQYRFDDDQIYDEIATLLDPVFDERNHEPLPSMLKEKLKLDAIRWITPSDR